MGILKRFFGGKPEEQERAADEGSVAKPADKNVPSQKTGASEAATAATAAADGEAQRGPQSHTTAPKTGGSPIPAPPRRASAEPASAKAASANGATAPSKTGGSQIPAPPRRASAEPPAARAASPNEATGLKPAKPKNVGRDAKPSTAGQQSDDRREPKMPHAPRPPLLSGAKGRGRRDDSEEKTAKSAWEAETAPYAEADKRGVSGLASDKRPLPRGEDMPAGTTADDPGARPRSSKPTLRGFGEATGDTEANTGQEDPSRQPPLSARPSSKRPGRTAPSPAAQLKAAREKRTRFRTDAGAPAHARLKAMSEEPPPGEASPTPPAEMPPAPSAERPDDVGTEIDVRAAVTALFEAAAQGGMAPATTPEEIAVGEVNRHEVESIFAELAKGRAAPIRDFAMELSLGLTPRLWAKHARAAAKTLAQAAGMIKNESLKSHLNQFEEGLEEASRQFGPCLAPALHGKLAERCRELAEAMPDVFALGEMQQRREQVLVSALLSQVPNVRKIVVDKLQTAGLSTYAGLCSADHRELAAAAGIDGELAETIVRHFGAHQKWRESTAPDRRNAMVWETLERLVHELQKQQTAFCEADENDDVGQKRSARQAWQATLAEVHVWLASLDEVDLVQSLERMPLERKIEQLRKYLQQVTNGVSATNDLSSESYLAIR